MKKLIKYISEKIIDKGRWLVVLITLYSIVIALFLFFSDNEILSIFIPIILSEIIPRLYSSNKIDMTNNSRTDSEVFVKTDRELIVEDQIILLLYLSYISTCIFYFTFTLLSTIDKNNNNFCPIIIFLVALFLYIITLIFLIKISDYISKNFYNNSKE